MSFFESFNTTFNHLVDGQSANNFQILIFCIGKTEEELQNQIYFDTTEKYKVDMYSEYT